MQKKRPKPVIRFTKKKNTLRSRKRHRPRKL